MPLVTKLSGVRSKLSRPRGIVYHPGRPSLSIGPLAVRLTTAPGHVRAYAETLAGVARLSSTIHGIGSATTDAIVNTALQWFTKTGTLQRTQRLGANSSNSISGSFFQPLTPANTLFDPRVIYDQYNGRFAVTPEFPSGTYAYFTTIDATGAAAYPYIVGPSYYGTLQNDNRTLNCASRFGVAASVIVPNCGVLTKRFGVPRLVRFRALKSSARN